MIIHVCTQGTVMVRPKAQILYFLVHAFVLLLLSDKLERWSRPSQIFVVKSWNLPLD
jgi:hypothetical protein